MYCLTFRSARTPPALSSILSHFPAFLASLSASVQAGPVSFVRYATLPTNGGIMARCKAITQQGTKCTRQAAPDSGFCIQHGYGGPRIGGVRARRPVGHKKVAPKKAAAKKAVKKAVKKVVAKKACKK